MYKISDKVIDSIEKTMKTWKVELTAGGRSLTEAKVQRCIFQRDSISPLLFIITMILLNHIVTTPRAGRATPTISASLNQTTLGQ